MKNMNGNIELVISIGFTLFTGSLMMVVYRLCHDALTYNRRFNITLLMLSFVSTILLTLIQNNPMLSLGVLGSLSICRIRTNTKDPRDLGFVFWALSIGISSAVGAFIVSFISSLLLGTVLLIFNHSFERKKSRMVIVRGEKQNLEPVQEMLGQTQGSSVQSKNVFADTFELVYKVQVEEKEEEKQEEVKTVNFEFETLHTSCTISGYKYCSFKEVNDKYHKCKNKKNIFKKCKNTDTHKWSKGKCGECGAWHYNHTPVYYDKIKDGIQGWCTTCGMKWTGRGWVIYGS